MKLYSMPLSPFAGRVRVAIARKGLDVEIVPAPSGGPNSREFLSINPMGLLPTLVLDDGFAIPEAAVILEYLEDAFPEPSLRPSDAKDLSRVRLLSRLPDIYLRSSPGALLGMRDPATRDQGVADEHLTTVRTALSFIDRFIQPAPFAVGERASLADCTLIPVLFGISLVERVFALPDLISSFGNVEIYWSETKKDPVNQGFLASEMAAVAAIAGRSQS